jgi:tetratricopeptide (TPR) repeat protein
MTSSSGLKVAIIVVGLVLIALLLLADRKALVNSESSPENNPSAQSNSSFFPSGISTSDTDVQTAISALNDAVDPAQKANIWKQLAQKSSNAEVQVWAFAQAATLTGNAEELNQALQAFDSFQYPQDSTLAAAFKNAELTLRESARLNDPADKQNRMRLALLLVETEGRSMEGILDLRKLSEEYPQDAGIQTLLGDFAVRTAQWAKAEERYRKALSIAPESGAPAAGLAKVLQQTGRMDEAKKYALDALKDENLSSTAQSELKVLFNL